MQLALHTGEIAEAEAIWSRSAGGDSNRELSQVLQAVDGLMGHGQGNSEEVLAITGRLLREDPGNWEALYREGRALAALDRHTEARQRFQKIIDLRRDDDELSVIVKARRKSPLQATTSGARMLGRVDHVGARYRTIYARYARALSGLDPVSSTTLGQTYAPLDFGQARMVAFAGLLAEAQREKTEGEWLERRAHAVEQAPNDPRRLWDDFYVALIRFEPREAYETARALAQAAGRDPSADYAFLSSLGSRNDPQGDPRVTRTRGDGETSEPALPLPPEEVDLILAALPNVARSNPNWLFQAASGRRAGRSARAGRAARPADGSFTARWSTPANTLTTIPAAYLGWLPNEATSTPS